MHGFGSHTFKLVNAQGVATYCKFHFLTNQGIKNLTPERAGQLASENPDYAIKDLYDAIARGEFPSWNAYIQVMSFEEAEKASFNPFDVTKIWPHKQYPLIPVGKFTLNKNPDNYFSQIEQIAFAPSHFVPGIEASPDKMLQGRLFSYPDTHRHRLGPNSSQIPVNCPYRTTVANYQRDGFSAVQDNNQGGAPNYFPNSFNGPQPVASAKEHVYQATGDVKRHESGDEDNFSQVGDFWNKALNDQGRANLAKNLAANLSGANVEIQKRVVANFTKCDPAYGKAIQDNLNKLSSQARL
jgi:catalase